MTTKTAKEYFHLQASRWNDSPISNCCNYYQYTNWYPIYWIMRIGTESFCWFRRLAGRTRTFFPFSTFSALNTDLLYYTNKTHFFFKKRCMFINWNNMLRDAAEVARSRWCCVTASEKVAAFVSRDTGSVTRSLPMDLGTCRSQPIRKKILVIPPAFFGTWLKNAHSWVVPGARFSECRR